MDVQGVPELCFFTIYCLPYLDLSDWLAQSTTFGWPISGNQLLAMGERHSFEGETQFF